MLYEQVENLSSLWGGSWVEREAMGLIPSSSFLMCGVVNEDKLNMSEVIALWPLTLQWIFQIVYCCSYICLEKAATSEAAVVKVNSSMGELYIAGTADPLLVISHRWLSASLRAESCSDLAHAQRKCMTWCWAVGNGSLTWGLTLKKSTPSFRTWPRHLQSTWIF